MDDRETVVNAIELIMEKKVVHLAGKGWPENIILSYIKSLDMPLNQRKMRKIFKKYNTTPKVNHPDIDIGSIL